jgi:hypothetical protein
MPFVSGVKGTFDNNTTNVIEIFDGLKYLSPSQDGIKILKMLGLDGFTFHNHEYKWRETVLASRKEVITIDNSSTALTVADAYQYAVNTIIRSESEIMRVTAIPGPTTLTVTRGYGGTSAAAHTAKMAIDLGTAMPEGADASAGLSDNGTEKYNYDQVFERGVSLTKHEMAALSSGDDKMAAQIARRTIELYRQIASAMFNGVRFKDTTNEIYGMGGLKQFVTTNVTNVGGAVSRAAIDAIILAIVQAGGDPKTITVSPYQKTKLDALDLNLIQIGKREHTGGGLATHTWQSGVLDHDLDIIVDHSILDDELHINDWDHVKLGHLTGGDEPGNVHIVDSTKPGANRKEQVIRADIGMKVELEKGQGYLYGLT